MSAAVSSTSSNTADHGRSASWFAPTVVSGGASTNTRKRRRGLAPRERGNPHVEAGGLELRTRGRHEVPGFVLAQDDLAAPRATRPQQRGQHAFEARDLVFEMRPAGARVHDRLLDRKRLAASAGREHREMPGFRVVGRIEPDDQSPALPGDRPSPAFDARRDVARETGRRVERAAVEPAEERLGDIGGGADVRRRRRRLELAGAVATDRVDHPGERGAGQRARVDVLVQREQRSGHRLDQAGEAHGIDERRRPAHRVRAVRVAGAPAPTRALAEERNHRAARGELDRPDRDPAQPADARADALDLAGAGRDQPAEHLADRDRLGVGLAATRQRHRAVARPPRMGRTCGLEHVDELIATDRRGVATRGPRDDASGFPRDLYLDDAGLDALLTLALWRPWLRRDRRRVALGRPPPDAPSVVRARWPVCRAQASASRRCSDSRSAMTCSRSSPRSDRALARCSSASRSSASSAPRDRIGLEDRELLGRGLAVDLGVDVHVELPGRERRRRRRSCHRSPLVTTEDATCVLEECGPGGRPVLRLRRPADRRTGNPAPPYSRRCATTETESTRYRRNSRWPIVRQPPVDVTADAPYAEWEGDSPRRRCDSPVGTCGETDRGSTKPPT